MKLNTKHKHFLWPHVKAKSILLSKIEAKNISSLPLTSELSSKGKKCLFLAFLHAMRASATITIALECKTACFEFKSKFHAG